MAFTDGQSLDQVIAQLKADLPPDSMFLQASLEMLTSIRPFLDANPDYVKYLPHMLVPDREIKFKTSVNTSKGLITFEGYRIQFNNALGPYKGGLRFHPHLKQDEIKFLAFEQIFKNALTGIPMGGAKGGAKVDIKGASPVDKKRILEKFCVGLSPYIGAQVDVPAGDVNMGGPEICLLFNTFKKINKNEFSGVFTGKHPLIGGSHIREEATGYGVVYILNCLGDIRGKTIAISGAGNVSFFALKKCVSLGYKVVSISDTRGTLYKESGFTDEDVRLIEQHKLRAGVALDKLFGMAVIGKSEFFPGSSPWDLDVVPLDVALPCAFQNEVGAAQMRRMVAHGCRMVVEGANMPLTNDAIDVLKATPGNLYIPGKAGNAGGVAVSGLEMIQNAHFTQWTTREVDGKLKTIMETIFDDISSTAAEYGRKNDFQFGANVAGFVKVVKAMEALGEFL